MEKRPQSAFNKAKKDTIHVFGTIRFWLFEALLVAFLTILVIRWQPSWVKEDTPMIYYQVLVPVMGGILGLAVVFLISLFIAPYKQRNEARALLMKRPKPIPLSNRDTLIRNMDEAKTATLEFINVRRQLAVLVNQKPNDIDENKADKILKDSQSKYNEALRLLDCEKLVAGYEYEPLINSLINVMHLVTAFWNSIVSSEDVFKSILESNIKETIKHIDELSQPTSRNED